MEKKTRYCHFCGDKTNDMVCTICGKATKPVSLRMKETELHLVSDDIADTRESFSGDQGHAESKRYHAQRQSRKLFMENGEHPYYQQGKNKETQGPAIVRAISVMAVIVVFILLVCLMLGIFTHRS